MEKKPRYTLGKKDRLKSRKTIEWLFRDGNSFSHFPFRVIFQLQPATAVSLQSTLQAGFSVSSRHFRKASDRNRVKRLMREAYRLQRHPLQTTLTSTGQQMAIFLIFTTNEIPSFEFVHEKTGTLLKRLLTFVNSHVKSTA